jgi:hypothetical protein
VSKVRTHGQPWVPARSPRASGQPVSSLPGRAEHGSVTAETAMLLPLLVAVTLGLVWLVALAATQVRVVDAAREVARAVARDEHPGEASELGRRVAPSGARIAVEETDDTVTVRVVSDVRGPGGLFRFLPGVEVDAEAVAAQEQQ